MKKGYEVRVQTRPRCDLCIDGTLAEFDGKTKEGPWAFMCGTHFHLFGVGLGVGRGQALLTEEASSAPG